MRPKANWICDFAGVTKQDICNSNGDVALMVKNNDVDKFYTDLIEFAFNRKTEINSWAWDLDLQEPTATPENVAFAICRLCVNSGEDLKNFSDPQVAGGLTYIFNSSFSDFSFDILSGEISPELRNNVFHSLQLLFANCFEQRCSPRLSHGPDGILDNPLNGACYMFWDTTPLSNGGLQALRTMEDSIYLRNVACIESGLHGLGHAFYQHAKHVEFVIDKFLASSPNLDERILTYAISARRGYVN
jgi:hypothetical protein